MNCFQWPEMPPLPPPGHPVLIRVVTALPRQAVRQELRTVLRTVLGAWSALAPDQLPLTETPRGPVWKGFLHGLALDISLSYAEGESWIGFIRDGWIGVDAMRIRTIPEAEKVARHYLDPATLTTIRQSSDPAMAFAQAWTELEARLKCLKQDLKERPETRSLAFAMTKCAIESMVLPERAVVTAAIKMND